MYELTKVDDISILRLYGDIAVLEIEFIQKLFSSLKECQHHKVLIDLAFVDHIHFKAFQTWATEANTLRTVSGDLKLVHPNKKVKETLKFSGVDQHLEDYSTLGEAILSFLKNPPLGGEINQAEFEKEIQESESKGRWRRRDSAPWFH